MAFIITADSVPVPMGAIPGGGWSCADYVQWHQLNVSAYGLETANTKMLQAWGELSFWDWNYSWCKYNGSFANYFKSVGLDPNDFFSNVYNGVGNIGDAVNNSTAVLKWLVPLLLIIAAIILITWAYKNFAV
jgi:hypothetical protein